MGFVAIFMIFFYINTIVYQSEKRYNTKNFDKKKKQKHDEIKQSIYKTLRIKVKSISIYKKSYS